MSRRRWSDVCVQRESLHQNVGHHVAADTRQASVETLELYGESFVVDAEHVQHGRVKIVHADRILFGRIAEFVRRTIADAALDAAAGNQVGEALDMVIAAVSAALVTIFALSPL